MAHGGYEPVGLDNRDIFTASEHSKITQGAIPGWTAWIGKPILDLNTESIEEKKQK
jgi:hypothetical protein